MMLSSFTCEDTNKECREEVGDPIIIPDIHKDFAGGERKNWIGYARLDS
jgi:hypothetical protein